MAVYPVCGRGAVGQATPRTGCGSGSTSAESVRGFEDFLFAGSSALLLLVADLFPAYGIASCAALIPLLFRLFRAEPARALRLGLYFGVSFFGVAFIDLCLQSPLAGLLKIGAGTALFGLFGWMVAWGRWRWGFNPLIVSLLWIGLELAVIKLGFGTGLLAGSKAGHPVFHGMAALFGFLSISFLIVLLNSLIITALNAVSSLAPARERQGILGERHWDLLPPPGPVAIRLCLSFECRGPPAP